MIRVENMVTEITKKDNTMTGSGYKGKLTTINKVSGNVARVGLEKATQPTSIPKWVAKKNYCELGNLSGKTVPDARHSLALFLSALCIRDESSRLPVGQ